MMPLSHGGLSAQPFYGGPVCFVRNVQYNVGRAGVQTEHRARRSNDAALLVGVKRVFP